MKLLFLFAAYLSLAFAQYTPPSGGGTVTLPAINNAVTPCSFSGGTLTCAGFATTGTTGGELGLRQGTLPALGTNSINFIAPTAVTAYGLIYPGGAPAAPNQVLLWGMPSSNYSTAAFTTVCLPIGSPTANYILVDNGSGCPTESGSLFLSEAGGNVQVRLVNPGNATTDFVFQNTLDLWEFGLESFGAGGFNLGHSGGCNCIVAHFGATSDDAIGLGPGNSSIAATTTVDITNTIPTTGHTFVNIGNGAADTSSTETFAIAGIMKFGGSNATASVAGVIGTTCPAITCTAAYTWIRAMSSDGSTVYLPAWK
jgi:hypothetical protein